MKKPYKLQEFRLPLIEQSNKGYFSKYSKDSTKRTNRSSKNSFDARSMEKEKNAPKASNFMKIKENKSLLKNKSLDEKELSRSMGNSCEETLTDFEEKIKENKLLLKKCQLEKLIEKQQFKTNIKTLGKENTENELDKLTECKSKKTLMNLNNKMNPSIVRESEESSKTELKTIVEDPDLLEETLNKRKYHLKRLNKKLKNNDIFENIHILLSGLQSDNLDSKSSMEKEKIYKKILKYKQKLQNLEPNLETEFINSPLDRKSSLPLLPQVNNSLSENSEKAFYKTKLPWERIIINKSEINKLSSSFEQEIEKVDFYLNKSSVSLEELLKNKMQVVDLLLINKMKEKSPNKFKN